jgi:hypothetical protein
VGNPELPVGSGWIAPCWHHSDRCLESLQDWRSSSNQDGKGDSHQQFHGTNCLDCLNNKFDDCEEDNQQGHLFNDLSPMTDLKQAPHQEKDESSRNKRPRAVDVNKDSNSGVGEIDLASGGSVKTSFSPLTAESATHSKWKTPVLPGKDRAARLACHMCKKLTALKCIQCNHSHCDDGSGTGGNLCFCWTKHQDCHHAL